MQFPLDPNMSEWVRPKLNRRNPHELHWRRQPPEWHGSIDKTHGHLYSHLADETCCMQCGAVPCPFDHDEHRRLKLADLDFVKELAKERRELKDKVNKLQQFIRNMEDRQLEWKAEKIWMSEQLRQYERLQKDWERQKSQMEGEIERLKMMNADNLKRIQAYKKDQEKLRILTQRVKDLENENSSLKDENKRYRQLISSQSDTIQGLETTNQELTKENEESQYHIRKLRVQLDESYEELSATRKALASKQEQVVDLESSLSVLTQELARRVKEFNEREEANQKLVKELNNELERLRTLVRSLDRENGDLKGRIEEYLKELEFLRSKLASDTRFKQFVHIKRECTNLKDRNDTLMFKVYEHEKICPPMPFMNAKGRVKSAVRKRSESPPSRRPVSASADKLLLNRPKSAARTLISVDSMEGNDA